MANGNVNDPNAASVPKSIEFQNDGGHHCKWVKYQFTIEAYVYC